MASHVGVASRDRTRVQTTGADAGSSAGSTTTEKVAKAALASRAPPVRHIPHVHKDRVTTLLPLPNGTFISGSKDGVLSQRDMDGNLLRTVYDDSSGQSSRITALSTMGPDNWLSGTLTGDVDLWGLGGQHIRSYRDFVYAMDGADNRVNCISDRSSVAHTLSFNVGWTDGQFTTYNNIQGEPSRLATCRTRIHDGVYGIAPLSQTAYLVAAGTQLQTSSYENNRWSRTPHLDESDTSQTARQRPYISSIISLTRTSYGLAVSGGHVKVYDLVKCQTTFKAQEHQGGVGPIVNMKPKIFASCADDGLIKIWDTRKPGSSTRTIGNRPDGIADPVSALLLTGEHTLLSASCPDKPRGDEGASFFIRDLRV